MFPLGLGPSGNKLVGHKPSLGFKFGFELDLSQFRSRSAVCSEQQRRSDQQHSPDQQLDPDQATEQTISQATTQSINQPTTQQAINQSINLQQDTLLYLASTLNQYTVLFTVKQHKVGDLVLLSV